ARGHTIDLGMEGAQLQLDRSLQAGTGCRLALLPRGETRRLYMYARVVGSRNGPFGGYRCHVRFAGRDRRDLSQLANTLLTASWGGAVARAR
ncbi:MAG: PilZ domain-containing protein, partial [Candidatus Eremiobacterota bacterium]